MSQRWISGPCAGIGALCRARSALVGVLLLVAYYLLPLNKPEDIGVLLLVGAWWSPGRSGRS